MEENAESQGEWQKENLWKFFSAVIVSRENGREEKNKKMSLSVPLKLKEKDFLNSSLFFEWIVLWRNAIETIGMEKWKVWTDGFDLWVRCENILFGGTFSVWNSWLSEGNFQRFFLKFFYVFFAVETESL